MFLNLTKAPYNDVNFRKGVSLSLDRTPIAQKAVNGYTTEASLSGLILPNQEKWLDPSLPNKGNVSPGQGRGDARRSPPPATRSRAASWSRTASRPR